VNYLIAWHLTSLLMVVTGSTFPNLARNDLVNLQIEWPNKSERVAITNVLGALDDKIESNRRQHSLIEQTVEATFQNICANFSGKYQVMGNIVEQGVSGVWGSDTQQSESEVRITCLRGVDLHDLASGVIPTAPLRWISAGQSASRVPQEGEIWVEASGFRCGRSVIIGSHTNALFAQPVRNSNFVKRLVPKISVRDSYIAWLALKKVYSSEEINNFRTGTSIRNLDVEGMLKNVRVPILDDARFSQLEGLLECLLSPSRAKETSTLESLRDTLLPELLSGRLRVKDAESMMENV
jgi:type I restriction enzyme S subunit